MFKTDCVENVKVIMCQREMYYYLKVTTLERQKPKMRWKENTEFKSGGASRPKKPRFGFMLDEKSVKKSTCEQNNTSALEDPTRQTSTRLKEHLQGSDVAGGGTLEFQNPLC